MIFIYYDKPLQNVALAKFLDLTNFGDIHVGKKSLRNTFSDLISPHFKFKIATDLSILSEIEEPYILWSSDVAATDWDKVITLCKKLNYSNTNIQVNCGTSVLSFTLSHTKKDVLYLDNEDYLVQLQGIQDLAILTHENLLFRYFNSLKVDGTKIIKQSKNKKKIRAEYRFLSEVPKRLRLYFAEVTNYEEHSGSASYTVQKYDMLDSSVLYLHGGLDGKELTEFLIVISRFLNERQNVKYYNSVKDIDYLVIKKVQERAKQLQQWSGYSCLNDFICAHTDYADFDDVLEALFRAVKKKSNKLIQYPNVFSHGDLCLPNILYDKDNKLIKLIDPKGDQHSYLPSIYDIAKLSHSILGGYDHIINQKSTIEFDSNMQARSQINISYKNVAVFTNFLSDLNVDYSHVRLVEASLFLSMLPLHIDDKRKVFLLAIRGIELLNTYNRSL